ncbi:hypothetical protein GPZ77_17805 [Streptomyces sp. QHH-9511]|uniref:DUF7739 domain-containing protein n=1 Tax=Streptomyces sp. QHH-9511 TaxID=2684468 RepID=UPI00131682B1|nr:hypothetical protein [Streptomyces sp. QHH-9511]QGZ49980.1 hypothetical protein GPZ77_17805 [Streptomyces sp. QHH-9511]
MSTHLVTSHGADFFGHDRYPLPFITGLRDYINGVVPYDERRPLVKLLEHAAAEGAEFTPAQAQAIGEALMKVASHRFTKPKVAAAVRLLAEAAGRAATDGETWDWALTDEKELAT